MTPAGKLRAARARQNFAEAVSTSAANIDLARAALLIAAEDEAGVDVARYLARLDELGATARARLAHSMTSAIEAFNEFFFEELKFEGNQVNYYDARNSFLNEVLERRTGIPITLSIVYMEVGRRAGLNLEGIGLPGHFIVRASIEDDSMGTLFVDPFHRQILDIDGCQKLLDAMFDAQLALSEEHLRAATSVEILVRLLTNLKAIYANAKLYRQAVAIVERILLLVPDAATEHRDLGALLAQLGRFAEAIDELRRYLRASPNAPDKEEVGEQLKAVHAQLVGLS